MKAITIKQPFASLIVIARADDYSKGIKDVENRTSATKYRGKVLIHVAKPYNKHWLKLCTESLKDKAREGIKANMTEEQYYSSLGCIIGSVEIIDCALDYQSEWALPNKYHWVLAHPRLFPEPIPARGNLGLWNYSKILAEPEEENGELFCHCQLPVKEENQVANFIDHYRCNYCGGKWYK